MICTCRDPLTLGVVHRADAPCYYPEQREWQGLTHKERNAIRGKYWIAMSDDVFDDIEAKLKAKNGFPQTEKNK